MSKMQYDSDEELFFEPPKLSQYSLELLNDNKENIPSQVVKELVESEGGNIDIKESDLQLLDQDNDIIVPDHEEPQIPNWLQDKRASGQGVEKTESSRKKSFQSRFHAQRTYLGRPVRMSSRKSSNEIKTRDNKADDIHVDEVYKEQVKDQDVESTKTLSYTSSHSHVETHNHTVTNNTSTGVNEQGQSEIDFKNLDPYEYMEHHNIPKGETSFILNAYKAFTAKQYGKTEFTTISQQNMEKSAMNEQELYEQLRQDRAKQEELEAQIKRHQLEEMERHRKEEQKIQEQRRKQEKLEELRKEELRKQEEARERLQEQERSRFEEQKRERQRLYEVSQANHYQKEVFTPQQQHTKYHYSQEAQRTPEKKAIRSSEDKAALYRDYKSHAQSQREAASFNVVRSSETVPLKEEHYPLNTEILTVNGTQYERLELIGKGGSSKVYKVKCKTNNKMYAIKKVLFDEFDEASIEGFKGEIDLLVKLRDKKRVVRLVDYSLEQGCLHLVMECGDIDLAHVLNTRLKQPLDHDSVRFHAKEIFKCVKEVHDGGIVHSDLKPANFLFVKGTLKLIDFGISNAVPEHTVNIYRDSQIGTPNYMAPEALVDANIPNDVNANGTWKVGKPSDVWSCGCIIYQMIYGRPPYGQYNGHQRLLAIMNPEVEIQYPEKGLGNVRVSKSALQLMKSCLQRDPKSRRTAEELLEGPFLKPRIITEQFLQDLIGSAIQYGASNGNVSKQETKALASDVWDKIPSLNY